MDLFVGVVLLLGGAVSACFCLWGLCVFSSAPSLGRATEPADPPKDHPSTMLMWLSPPTHLAWVLGDERLYQCRQLQRRRQRAARLWGVLGCRGSLVRWWVEEGGASNNKKVGKGRTATAKSTRSKSASTVPGPSGGASSRTAVSTGRVRSVHSAVGVGGVEGVEGVGRVQSPRRRLSRCSCLCGGGRGCVSRCVNDGPHTMQSVKHTRTRACAERDDVRTRAPVGPPLASPAASPARTGRVDE